MKLKHFFVYGIFAVLLSAVFAAVFTACENPADDPPGGNTAAVLVSPDLPSGELLDITTATFQSGSTTTVLTLTITVEPMNNEE